ncbi:MAG TPA: DnaJ domain-containing protein [Polyangiaceae bacterium]
MHRRSLLRTLPCDLKQLPIGAREAFVLSQVHGRATVEDVAEVTGLALNDLLQVARRLVQLGALEVDEERPKTARPPASTPHRRSTLPPAEGRKTRTLVPHALVPVARKVADLRSMGIGPRHGFVLSQVDGKTTTEDLAEITGLSARELSDALRALEAAGVVSLGPSKSRPSKMPSQGPSKMPSKAPSRAPSRAPSPIPEKPRCDLPEADRTRITEASTRLEALDHYAALGIERDADAKAIRRAYHALAAQFHPDRFYGKVLGPFRQTLERIFTRLTLASDTLSHKGKREEYDATLAPLPAKRAPTAKPPPAKTPTRRSMRAARPSTVAPKRSPTVKPAPVPAPAPAPVADPLRRMYTDKQRQSVRDHLDVFVRAAKEALERDDVVAAANHYRLALQVSDDPKLRAELEQVDAKARVRVRDKSLDGARTAEQAGRWGDAATAYVKAYGAHSEAWIAERAANAMRQEGSDLRRAAQLAEQAVLAEPRNVGYRMTLGEICFDAGQLTRAAGEVERVLAISPGDPRAKALSKRIAKGKRESS